MKTIISAIKKSINVLLKPETEFSKLKDKSFEDVVKDYIIVLISFAIIAGVLLFILSYIRAVYLDIFVNIDIQYLRMLNYAGGIATSISFFYIFAGTFIAFFMTIILRIFIRKMKYTSLFAILLYSLYPLILFGWIPFNPLPLIIWSIFLFIIGVKSYKITITDKNSINQRD